MRHADKPGTGVVAKEKADFGAAHGPAAHGQKNDPTPSASELRVAELPVEELQVDELKIDELKIDELVLTGFSPADRFHIADAVEKELAWLLSEKGIAGLEGNSVELEGLDAGRFKVAPGARAHVIGKQAAQALHRQLTLHQAHKTPAKASAKKP